MKNKFKKILTFLLLVLVYFIPSFIFKTDNEYYNSLKGFKIPPFIFAVVWVILYTLNSIFITYHIYNKNHHNNDGSYKRLYIFLIANYICNAAYPLFFFTMHNLFLSYISCLLAFTTILLATMEASLINKKTSYLLIPNILWSFFASILSGVNLIL